MADFSIQDAAFTGFGVVREHRGYLPIWAAVALFVSLATVAAIIAVAGPAVATLQALSTSGSRDPATVFPLIGRLAPLYLIMLPATAVFYGVLCSAMNRAVLRPDERRFAYLAFGPDEFRQIGLLVLGFIVFSVIYILLALGVVIAAALLNVLAHIPPMVLTYTAIFLSIVIMTWLAVRLSLASALTFERRRLTLFGSWALTRGRFWPIFGTYVLVVALVAVISLLTWLVIVAAVTLVTGGNMSAAFVSPDFRTLGGFFTVSQLVQLVLQAGVSALIWPVMLTPPAAILRQISIAGSIGVVVRSVT